MKKDIINTNNKGQHHGYQEWYWHNDEFYLRGVWKNGQLHRYQEWHSAEQTKFYII